MYSHISIGRIVLIAVCICSLTSCKKFLETYSQNKSFINTAVDLQDVLLGDVYTLSRTDYPFLYTMDDDVKLATFTSWNRLSIDGFHYWQSNPWVNSEGVGSLTDAYYNHLYSKIARANVVLLNVQNLREKGEPADTLNRIAAESYFLRAYYYYFLANVYGKPYRSATSNTDLCIPLKLNEAVEEAFPVRATTGKVYNQIINDLLKAEQLIQQSNVALKTRANAASIQALLSRIYLFTEDYDKVISYADKVLANQRYGLYDLNTYKAGESFASMTSPEIIFTMGQYNLFNTLGLTTDEFGGIHYLPSEELIGSYAPEDLRRGAFYIQNSKGVWKAAKRKTLGGQLIDASDFQLIRLSEIYLNKAEALAMLGKDAEAKEVVRVFHRARFKAADIPTLSDQGEALVNSIRDERRRELCLEAHRWFDLRRYAVNSKYPYQKTIRHASIDFNGMGYVENGYYELAPYDQEPGAYVVPISQDEIEFSRGSLVNEFRPDRPLKN